MYDGELKAVALKSYLDKYAVKSPPSDEEDELDADILDFQKLKLQDLKRVDAEEDLWLIGFAHVRTGVLGWQTC